MSQKEHNVLFCVYIAFIDYIVCLYFRLSQDGVLLPPAPSTKSVGRRSRNLSQDHTYSKQKGATDGSDSEQVATSRPLVNLDLASPREVKVIDSSNAAGSMMELSAENLDEHLTVSENVEMKEEDKVKSTLTLERSVSTDSRGEMAVDKPPERDKHFEDYEFILDEVTGIVKQASLGFDVMEEEDRSETDTALNTGKDDDKEMASTSLEDHKYFGSDEKLSVLSSLSNQGEDKIGQKKSEKDDSSQSEFNVELLSENLPEKEDGSQKSEGMDVDEKQTEETVINGQPTSTEVEDHTKVDGARKENGEERRSDTIRELRQENESVESETRQYGDMSEDHGGGTTIGKLYQH